MRPVITLLTDFGEDDGYVAAMKGVILGICPDAQLVDVTHRIPPQNVRAGAYVLWTVYRCFPPHTVHLAVVDPGVGTERRGLAVQTPNGRLVGPDNGLFSMILGEEREWRSHALENAEFRLEQVSRTFHGRDIFAPAAARLALGAGVEKFGSRWRPHLAEWRQAGVRADEISGQVLHVDHFGNLITNVRETDLSGRRKPEGWSIRIVGRKIEGIGKTYADVAAGELLALIGSNGLVEIAVNRGSATRELKVGCGEPVSLMRDRC